MKVEILVQHNQEIFRHKKSNPKVAFSTIKNYVLKIEADTQLADVTG